MKIRTDFVTNSSSSCYCVSLKVDTAGESAPISLDLWPDGEDGTGSVIVDMRIGLNEFLDKVKACSSVDELKDLLVGFLDFSRQLERIGFEYKGSNEEILQVLDSETDKYKELGETDDDYLCLYYYASQLAEAYRGFIREFGKITSLRDIKAITVREFFFAWGEGSKECTENYLRHALPEELDLDDKDALKEALKCIFNENELKVIEQLWYEEIPFPAYITTTLDLETGIITRRYEISD